MLLEKLKKVVVPALRCFALDQATRDEANIGYMGLQGKEFNGHTEEDVPETVLCAGTLTGFFQYARVLDQELGGKEKAPVCFAHIVAMAKLQREGQPGDLLVDGLDNVACVRKGNGLWVVNFRWHRKSVNRGSWSVYVNPLKGVNGFRFGTQLFTAHATLCVQNNLAV